MPKNILENWDGYDNLKIKDNRDARFFSCTEDWERTFLKEKIKEHYPWIDPLNVSKAITFCCLTSKPNHPRKEFVECVCAQLGLDVAE